ncbi:MAG TPA: trimeric intracellular cation channel family protein [Rhizobacter sp.]|nr:trimeric intracellular cation channel family protein [Rhizobacter sp.]
MRSDKTVQEPAPAPSIDTLPGTPSSAALLYALDLFGVAVFAASGALAGIAGKMDLLGVLVLAAITAIGGGTLRDVVLGVRPVFWIKDAWPLYTIIAATVATVAWFHVLPIPRGALLVADALGLAVFALSGAQVAEKQGCSPLVVILMGTLTGSGGGVLRDVLSAKVPLILREDIYASAAILGIGVYLVLRAMKVRTSWAFAAGAVTVAGMRLVALALDLRLPVVPLAS